MSTQKEERSEWVSMYLTPSAAKEYKLASDNKTLQDEIIKRFISNETGWLKDDMKEMDEVTLAYRAKLLTIKDSFSNAQDLYVAEIENLYSKSRDAFKPIEDMFVQTRKSIASLKEETISLSKTIDGLSKSVGYIDYSRIEKLLDLIDRYNKMSDEEKALIQLILNNPKA